MKGINITVVVHVLFFSFHFLFIVYLVYDFIINI